MVLTCWLTNENIVWAKQNPLCESVTGHPGVDVLWSVPCRTDKAELVLQEVQCHARLCQYSRLMHKIIQIQFPRFWVQNHQDNDLHILCFLVTLLWHSHISSDTRISTFQIVLSLPFYIYSVIELLSYYISHNSSLVSFHPASSFFHSP